MNKDFENEYKEYSKLNTPDLWSRIEKGIDAVDAKATESVAAQQNVEKMQNAGMQQSGASQQSLAAQQNINQEKVVSLGNTVKKKKSFGKYAGIIAAAACAVIAIPTIILISQNGNGKDYSASPSAASEAAMDSGTTMDSEPMEYAEATTAATSAEYAEADSYETLNGAAYAETECEEAEYEEAEATYDDGAIDEAPSLAKSATNASSYRAEKEERLFDDLTPYFAEEFPGDIDKVDFEQAVTDPKVKVVIQANCNIKNIKFMRISITDVNDEGAISVDSETIISMAKLKKGDTLGVELTFFGDLPGYAVSYENEYGVEQFFTLYESGYDGSLLLNEETLMK